MLSINMDDVLNVLTSIRSYLIAIGVIIAIAVVLMIEVIKDGKSYTYSKQVYVE